MIDPEVLKSKGYTEEKLRGLFKPKDGDANVKDEIKELITMTSGRLQEGINRNLRNARWWWAIDLACDVTQRQASTTLAHGLLSNKNLGKQELESAINEWGLSSMLVPQIDPKTNRRVTDMRGNPIMKLDMPVFWNVFVPICLQYVKIRWATLFHDRDNSPLFKFQPIVYSRRSHLKNTILTGRAERMSQDMGYRSDLREEIFRMLKYGVSLTFSREPFYQEKQLARRRSKSPSNEETNGDGGDEKLTEEEVVVREGIRNTIPHPSRFFYDLSHPILTLNTNTGAQYAGHWDAYKYGEVASNKKFWISDEDRKAKAAFGSGTWIERQPWTLFSQLYPCSMSVPDHLFSDRASATDRTSESTRFEYTRNDQAVIMANIFQRIIPKDYGLFDYEYPVWFGFTMANSVTPLYVEPYCYTPVRACIYDADQNKWQNSSMVSDLMPFQDHIGNLISQYILTIRRNLANLTFYNSDAVDPKVIEVVSNLGKSLYADFNFVPISFQDLSFNATAGTARDQFQPISFPQADAYGHATAINMILGIIDRVVGFTAQEIGSTASHVQTAEEVRVIRSYNSSRIALTDSFIDSSVHAWKVQIYEAIMAYGDDIVMAEVADLSDVDRKELEDLGFTIEEGSGRKAGVFGPKSSLSLAAFASDREGSRRSNDAQTATAFMQFASSLMSVPEIVQRIGISRVVNMFNSIADLAGLPNESKLPELSDEEAQQPGAQEELMGQIRQFVEQFTNQQLAEVGKALKEEELNPMTEAILQMRQELAALTQRQESFEGAVEQLVDQSRSQMPMMQ